MFLLDLSLVPRFLPPSARLSSALHRRDFFCGNDGPVAWTFASSHQALRQYVYVLFFSRQQAPSCTARYVGEGSFFNLMTLTSDRPLRLARFPGRKEFVSVKATSLRAHMCRLGRKNGPYLSRCRQWKRRQHSTLRHWAVASRDDVDGDSLVSTMSPRRKVQTTLRPTPRRLHYHSVTA